MFGFLVAPRVGQVGLRAGSGRSSIRLHDSLSASELASAQDPGAPMVGFTTASHQASWPPRRIRLHENTVHDGRSSPRSRMGHGRLTGLRPRRRSNCRRKPRVRGWPSFVDNSIAGEAMANREQPTLWRVTSDGAWAAQRRPSTTFWRTWLRIPARRGLIGRERHPDRDGAVTTIPPGTR